MKKLIYSILILFMCIMTLTLLSCGGDDETTTTPPLVVPTFEIVNTKSTRSTVGFEITETDPDNAGEIKSIELYQNGVKIKTAESTDVRKFSNLTQNTKYTVKVTYSYDLQNGEGEKTDNVTLDIYTTADGFTSRTDIKKDWEGKTLNIICQNHSMETGAPWSIVELCVKEGEESGFGIKIDAAVLERQEYIKKTYGVELNWIKATSYIMHDALEAAKLSGNMNYDLALPRSRSVQSMVSNGFVYDLKNRDYIDFSNPYYNKDSVEAYTAKGHTFFVDGDFSILSKEGAYALYFNKELLGGEQATAELYQKVKEGKWTWDKLVALASVAYKDNGDGLIGDNDTYGLSVAPLQYLYYYFGVKQAGVDEITKEWKITLNDGRIDDIISAIIEANTSRWCRTQWGGIYPDTPFSLLVENKILFYASNIQDGFRALNHDNVGVVPFPMLNEEQGRYCVFTSNIQAVFMCIPKTTQDREMSEYFLDVLSWTGSEYITKAYLEQKTEYFGNDEDMEILVNYIFPNIIYDAGDSIGWDTLMGDVLWKSYEDNVNKFDEVYASCEPKALETIAEWNKAWGAYTED